MYITETAKKIIIPESIAIKLANTSEVSAEYFFRDIYRRYQQYQKQERKERQKGLKRMRIHNKPSNADLLTIREQTIIESIRSTVSTMETSSIVKNTDIPTQLTTRKSLLNSLKLRTKDQAAFVDDEDLENDLEASGLNRIKNDTSDTSNAFNFDDTNETES